MQWWDSQKRVGGQTDEHHSLRLYDITTKPMTTAREGDHDTRRASS